MITFIHTGDVHLDMEPDKGCAWSKTRGQEIWQTFRRLVDVVAEKKPDVFLIAGDLFHREPTEQELKELNYLFTDLTATKVVMIAGNHDYIHPFGAYEEFAWADNVCFLTSEAPSRVCFSELDLEVCGFSYHKREAADAFPEAIEPDQTYRHHILLAHGGDSNHFPVDWNKLGAKGFDYLAFGHIHHPQLRPEINMAYCGSLEPTNVNDKGTRGYIEGTIDEEGTRFSLVPFAKREYKELVFDVTGKETLMAIGDGFKKALEEAGADNLFDVRITGLCGQDISLTEDFFSAYGNIVRVVLDMKYDFDFAQLAQEHGSDMIGMYIKTYWKSEMNEQEEKTLYYGIKALLDSQRMG